ncbi:hypothetical protein LIER_21786 [Lithospermum erythrorhizon]|uniref:Transmembrane protein n=1 Tax=Lithospermum erythrorhizon TaxID=34254 RepID=A0AAV3QVM0_LITER
MAENSEADHGWKTVSYHKKTKKKSAQQAQVKENGFSSSGDVFRSIEEHSEGRRKRIIEAEAQRAAAIAAEENNSMYNHYDGSEEEREREGEEERERGGDVVEKKMKKKKLKKPKVTVAEAAAKIDASDLDAFLADISASYETQQDIVLMRFADYFGRAFAMVNSSQFPWVKLLKESPVAKMVDVPLSHISEDVFKTSTEWLSNCSIEALVQFVMWSLDSVLADLCLHLGAGKGSKKTIQQASSKSQVAIFVVLAMVLRRKPDVLINLLPTLTEDGKYQGPDKLFVFVWMITQASQGDLVVGLFAWAHFLLPLLSTKAYNNPQSRDLILQLVERILSSPKARTILVNGAVRKGERVVPPAALELLMHATFPAPSARVKDKTTERFEAVYPTLKEVALSVSPGSKAMKQLTQQIIPIAIKAAGGGVPDQSREGSELFIWCLMKNPECYKQWDDIYLNNIEATVVILKKLYDEIKVHPSTQSSLDPLKATLKSFRLQNEEAITLGANNALQSTIKDSEKYCKMLLGRVSRGHGCAKGFLLVTVAVAASAVFLSKDIQSLDLNKLLAQFNQS